MWQNLRHDDVERAKQELRLRRDEMLCRHAAEIKGFDAEHEAIDALAQMVAAFARKFKNAAAPTTIDNKTEIKKPLAAGSKR